MLTLVQPTPVPEGHAVASASGLSYNELKKLGFRSTEAGDLASSLAYYQESLEVARATGEKRLVDQAICNCGAVLITLGRQQEAVSDLRQILMAGRCSENGFLAAINLSRAYVREKSPKKALFYSQIARDRAPALGNDEWLVWSYNQLANCLVDESRFKEAAKQYQRALRLLSEKRSATRAMLLANLGYCQMIDGKVKDGMTLSFQALRWFRYLGARVYEVIPELDLCYAYIELGRYDRARTHGRRGLELAEETGEPERMKIALYLLGETESAAGNLEEAYGYYSRLQQGFYPESPQFAELMMVVDARQVVNLRA